MDEENNNTSGPEEPISATTAQVTDLAAFRKNKANPQPVQPWPVAGPTEPVVTASEKDPNERRILISSTYGDVVMDGYLGLSQTFLAVGDHKGQIKFALAPGVWLAACDVTNDPEYADKPDDVA
jgi:hypothetical protein